MNTAVLLVGASVALFWPDRHRLSPERRSVPPRLRQAVHAATEWRRRKNRQSLPLILELLARELRAGSTVPVALASVAWAEPAAESLRSVAQRVGSGGRVGDELDLWASQFDHRDADMARAMLRLGLGTGAALADALDRLATTLRARIELDDELRALTAQSRASAWLLALAPVGFLLVLGLAVPEMIGALFTEPIGLACLFLGLLLDGLGFAWMRRLVDGVDR